MAQGINKVILIGNLGDVPELRYMPSGAAACNFSLATTESWKDAQGQKQERTEWHRCSAFDRGNYKMAQYIAESCQKGTKLYVEGSLQTREWEKDGIKRYTTEIKVNDFQVLSGGIPKEQQGGGGQGQSYGGQPQQPQNPPAQPQSFGGNGQGGFGDPWVGLIPAGEPATKGATIEDIKNHAQVNGDAAKAKQLGWAVETDDIPFS